MASLEDRVLQLEQRLASWQVDIDHLSHIVIRQDERIKALDTRLASVGDAARTLRDIDGSLTEAGERVSVKLLAGGDHEPS